MSQQTDYIFPGGVDWPRPAGVSTADIVALWAAGGAGGAAFQNADTSYAQGGGAAGSCVARLTAVPISGATLPVDFGAGAYTSLGFGGGYSARVNKAANGGDASESTGGTGGVADISGVTFNAPPATGSTHAYLGQSGTDGISPDDNNDDSGISKPNGGHAANSDGNWNAGSLNDGGAGGTFSWDSGWVINGAAAGGGGQGSAAAFSQAAFPPGDGGGALIKIVYTVPAPSGSMAALLILDLF
jgi:hypothetical protein